MIRAAVLLVVLGAAGIASADAPHWKPACADHTCKSHIRVDAQGKIVATAAVSGVTADDLKAAYGLDYALGSGATVAVVDAYGYRALESDLATYRAQFGMPPCTVASGCLTIVNDNGDTAPLPAEDSDWLVETALDVDMVSAGCPLCKIIVVQSSAGGAGLDIGQVAAVGLHATTISNSWGGAEDVNVPNDEATFNNPGTGTFSGGGDNGFDSVQPGNVGPVYPSTSLHVIAVGGTTLTHDGSAARGYAETAWSHGGSSCSTYIFKPDYQPVVAACSRRAATDISAAADGGTQGIAIYVAQDGGWTQVDGTSAASPLSAAIFAAAGHGDAVPEFVYRHPEAFDDVTTGTNGTCGTNLCDAGAGWDGPTGLGTPNQAKLVAIGNVAGAGPDVSVTYPADGATVAPRFGIQVAAGSDAVFVTVDLDGTRLASLIDPYTVQAPPTLGDGVHTITVTSYDLDHNSQTAMVSITQSASAGSDVSTSNGGGGCSTSGSGGGAVLSLLALVRRRRR
jgi:hypothetical protein